MARLIGLSRLATCLRGHCQKTKNKDAPNCCKDALWSPTATQRDRNLCDKAAGDERDVPEWWWLKEGRGRVARFGSMFGRLISPHGE